MKIENLNVKYENKPVFSNFNLDIVDGLTTCFLGASGAGKTTLLNAVLSLAQNENKKVSVAFQEPRLFEHLTVYENLRLIGYGHSEIIKGLNETFLSEVKNSYPNNLSGGEKQRVNFLRAILSEFDVLLLDEPFSSLDVKTKLSLINLLIEKTQGKTVVFVTHDIEEALMLSSKVLLINNGKVKLDYDITVPIKERSWGKLDSERKVLLNAQLL